MKKKKKSNKPNRLKTVKRTFEEKKRLRREAVERVAKKKIRAFEKSGFFTSLYVDPAPAEGERAWNFFDDQFHSIFSSDNFLEEEWTRYEYVREQLELNAVRRGANLVDPERTRHILDGTPVFKTTKTVCVDASTESNLAETPSASVRGWSGGHANLDAAKFGKTQIPEFWTGERFMYEVSDILSDANARWIRQETPNFESIGVGEDVAPRFVCVEERFGVPIRVVAEEIDDELKCVTAFPDYRGLAKNRTVQTSGDEIVKKAKEGRST